MKTPNEQKAKEICNCDSCKACSKFAEEGVACVFTSTCDRFNGLMQAMEWKDETFAVFLESVMLQQNHVEARRMVINKIKELKQY